MECESQDDRQFLKRHFELQDELAATLGCEVDLVSGLPCNTQPQSSINACRELVYQA